MCINNVICRKRLCIFCLAGCVCYYCKLGDFGLEIGEQLLLMSCSVIWVSVFVHMWEEGLGLRERVACESRWLSRHHKTTLCKAHGEMIAVLLKFLLYRQI